MGNSLQEQLLKAGLVDQERLREAEEARKPKPAPRQAEKAKGSRKGKGKSARRSPRPEPAKAAQATTTAPPKPDDKRRRRALLERVRALLKADGQSVGGGEVLFNYVRSGKVKRLYVSEEQRRGLADGSLAVAEVDGRHSVIPAATAEELKRFAPAHLVYHGNGEAEDPAEAEHPVPDDLIW